MHQNIPYQEQYDPPPFAQQLRDYVADLRNDNNRFVRHMIIAGIMIISLLAFELFNFDTTRYALSNLIGDIRFAGVTWASILAIAFCSIDFAGLIRIFTPDNHEGSREAWYLMGAWLLGATMNAMMTWWAISLTLLNHEFGNEVLSRDVLLKIVPVFVAVLVWVTRILFIGAVAFSGEALFKDQAGKVTKPAKIRKKRTTSKRKTTKRKASTPPTPQRTAARIKEKPTYTPRTPSVQPTLHDFDDAELNGQDVVVNTQMHRPMPPRRPAQEKPQETGRLSASPTQYPASS